MRAYHQVIELLNFNEKSKTVANIDIVDVIHKQTNLPVNLIIKEIGNQQLSINNKPVKNRNIYYLEGSVIKFKGQIIQVISPKEKSLFELFFEQVCIELTITSIDNISHEVKRPFCVYFIEYFSRHPYVDVNFDNSIYLDVVLNELDSLYRAYLKDTKDVKVPKRKELVEHFVDLRINRFQNLVALLENLKNGFYKQALYRFLQEYNKIANSPGFIFCIAPMLQTTVYSKAALEALIKPITQIQTKTDIDEKFRYYDSHKALYSNYLAQIDSGNEYYEFFYLPLATNLYNTFKEQCEVQEVKSSYLTFKSTSRKYNFNNKIRDDFDLFFTISNSGESVAREIQVEPFKGAFDFPLTKVGILKPGEKREVSVSAKLINDSSFTPKLTLKCQLKDGLERTRIIYPSIEFSLQEKEIPWETLEMFKPYSIQEIDDRKKLYGRDDILEELYRNIQSNNIESYKIWGQKRVGKSSIVKTLRTLFEKDEKIIVVWRSIAGLKNTNPIITLNTLGESLASEIFEEIDIKISDAESRGRLKSIPVPEFDGSLFPLETYIKKLKRIDSALRFIFILDEFDRINIEFFLPGEVGDTFSLNVGKGLGSEKYIGFILVGSENMHLLDRQEINYNGFQGREVDTFNKEFEYDSFKNIVIGPVAPFINYSFSAIEQIYNVTNGNPYFANLICSHIFKICSQNKDGEVDVKIVDKAISKIVQSSQKSHFEHFWADGITDDSNVRRDKKTDIRRRVLVSYSFIYFQNNSYPTKSEIIKSFKRPLEYEVEGYEIENTITEFFNRKIFFEIENRIRIKPSIFESWLCGPGRTLMIEGVADLEALQREKQMEVEHSLKKEEIKRLSDSYKFKGNNLSVDEFKKYFYQFGGPLEQRRIFKLIDSLIYFSKDEIDNFFKKEQRNIFKRREIELKIGVKTPYRDNVEIYSSPYSLKENSEIVESFKLYSHIRSSKTLKNIQTQRDAWKMSNSNEVVYFEATIDDTEELLSLLHPVLEEITLLSGASLVLVALLITTKAKADIIKSTSAFSNFKLISYREIEESKIKPFIETTDVFENFAESSYTFGEIKKHFHEISKECLNVLFEFLCPGRSIPIYWMATSQFKPIFPNVNGTFQTLKILESNNEQLRDRVYFANKELIQTLNPFLINYVKNKAKNDGKDDWFRMDYIPKTIIEKIHQKWLEEGQTNELETYFDLIHYKEIIKKNKELIPLFAIKGQGGDGLSWVDKLNETRRDPAHPEKPAPALVETQFFETTKDEIINRIKHYQPTNTNLAK